MGRVVIGESELGAIKVMDWGDHKSGQFIPHDSSLYESILEKPGHWCFKHLIMDSKNKPRLFTYAEFKDLFPEHRSGTWGQQKCTPQKHPNRK